MEFDRVFADVAEQVSPGSVVADFRPLLGGSSATVYGVALNCSDGSKQRLVFKHHVANEFKGHNKLVALKEHDVQQMLRDRGFPVPKPRHVDQSQALVVTDWVDGKVAVAAENRRSALDQMVDFLVELHSLETTNLKVESLGALEDPVTALPAYLPATELGQALRRHLDGGVTLHPNPSCLLHGDYWPGNVLWAKGQLVAVIDWEDAALGDPLADFACARLELVGEYDDQAMHHFSASYVKLMNHLDTRSLPLWETYVSASALTTMHLWGLEPAEEARRRAVTTQFFERAARQMLTSDAT